VQEVFGFFKNNLSAAQRRNSAASEKRGMGQGRTSCSGLSAQKPERDSASADRQYNIADPATRKRTSFAEAALILCWGSDAVFF
jgi:hypothetical protein